MSIDESLKKHVPILLEEIEKMKISEKEFK